ncbi:MAG: hypothetical protein NUV47_01200 [Patescibacteria group bacterium]|nr:hypothetical protein [Patescibacteria group bacterium]
MRYLAYSILGVAWLSATVILVFSVVGVLVLIFSRTWWELIQGILAGMGKEKDG